jgi:glycosyltransferase involved in cell wall biosynthesis
VSRWKTGGWKENYQTEKADVNKGTPTSRSVCLLTNTYPDFPGSSRAVFIRDLAQLLSQKNWKVSVVAPRIFAASPPQEKDATVEVRRFQSFLNEKLLVEYSQTPVLRLSGYLASGILSTISLVRKHRCDLIHAHWVVPAGLIGLIAGTLLRKPVVVTAHGSDVLVVPDRSLLLRGLVKFVLAHASAVTSVAEHVTEKIREMGVQRKEILTFPMSVPADAFASDGPLVDGWDAARVIFSNRSLYPLYNVESLVKAAPLICKNIPAARITIAGKGPEKENLMSLAESLGVSGKVEFIGEIPHGQMADYLRSSAAYVSTSLSDGASVSLLEAMACGAIPVVADIPANREWIKDGENGFLFPPADVKALAEKLEQCLVRPDVRQKAREINVRVIRQRAQWNSNVDKLLDLYDKIMAR